MVRPNKPIDDHDIRLPRWLAIPFLVITALGLLVGVWAGLVQVGLLEPVNAPHATVIPSNPPAPVVENKPKLAPPSSAPSANPSPAPEWTPDTTVQAQGDAEPPIRMEPRPNPTLPPPGYPPVISRSAEPAILAPRPQPRADTPPQMPQSMPPAAAAPELTAAALRRIPSPQMIAGYYPDRALERQWQGTARIRCRVEAGGRLAGCVALEETPAGWGFADASIQMAQRELAARQTDEVGRPTIGRMIVLQIRWQVAN